jgi:hypothetical protein
MFLDDKWQLAFRSLLRAAARLSRHGKIAHRAITGQLFIHCING